MGQVERLTELLAALKELQVAPAPTAIQRDYKFPSLASLKDYKAEENKDPIEASVLEAKLKEFGFEGKVENVRKGPVITRYEIRLAAGVRLAQIRKVSEDMAIALMSDKIRIQAPIPGTNLVGIEVVNEAPEVIGFRKILKATIAEGRKEDGLPIAIGTDIVGVPKVVDLTKMPHLLIAGMTGSGKSVCLNVLILSILYTKTPEECQLILIDPKRVEMTSYKGIPHLREEVVTDPEDACRVFDGLIAEMERRYEVLSQKGVRNILSYNKIKGVERMPYIVTVVDEMADLMMTAGKELEKNIVRIAQLARAVGIHLVLATQKPIVGVITGLIKSNMPSRIAFQVTSKTDSRVILDDNGAEKLIGRGDMLMIYPGAVEPERFHGPWISDGEIESVADSIKE